MTGGAAGLLPGGLTPSRSHRAGDCEREPHLGPWAPRPRLSPAALSEAVGARPREQLLSSRHPRSREFTTTVLPNGCVTGGRAAPLSRPPPPSLRELFHTPSPFY